MRKILFYGDSNTFGYDPADWTEGRYPAESRWTDILAREVSDRWIVLEEGLNGRKIPVISYSCSRGLLHGMLEMTGEGGIFSVMLGTNDLLCTDCPDARTAIKRMEELLQYLIRYKPAEELLLLAPPYIASESAMDPLLYRYHEESIKMNQGFCELAAEYKVKFTDTARWGVELCYDQVHFSEAGHRVFAEKMAEFLKETY